MGRDWSGASSYPLQYNSKDGKKSFSDWPDGAKPYGGWTGPSMKQYAEGQSLCGADKVNLLWYPG